VDTIGTCTTVYLLARPAFCDTLFTISFKQMSSRHVNESIKRDGYVQIVYYYVKGVHKKFFIKMSFSNHLGSFTSPLDNENQLLYL
jgi:hypothetical protein